MCAMAKDVKAVIWCMQMGAVCTFQECQGLIELKRIYISPVILCLVSFHNCKLVYHLIIDQSILSIWQNCSSSTCVWCNLNVDCWLLGKSMSCKFWRSSRSITVNPVLIYKITSFHTYRKSFRIKTKRCH